MRFHVRRLEFMVLLAWVIIIPPDAAGAVIIYTSCIRESIGLGTVENLRHKRPAIVKNSGRLSEVSYVIQSPGIKINTYPGIVCVEVINHFLEALIVICEPFRVSFNSICPLVEKQGRPAGGWDIKYKESSSTICVNLLNERLILRQQFWN